MTRSQTYSWTQDLTNVGPVSGVYILSQQSDDITIKTIDIDGTSYDFTNPGFTLVHSQGMFCVCLLFFILFVCFFDLISFNKILMFCFFVVLNVCLFAKIQEYIEKNRQKTVSQKLIVTKKKTKQKTKKNRSIQRWMSLHFCITFRLDIHWIWWNNKYLLFSCIFTNNRANSCSYTTHKSSYSFSNRSNFISYNSPYST